MTRTLARVAPVTPHPPHGCRWSGCSAPSSFYARDNRADFGHLCHAHWYACVPVARQGEYEYTAPALRASNRDTTP